MPPPLLWIRPPPHHPLIRKYSGRWQRGQQNEKCTQDENIQHAVQSAAAAGINFSQLPQQSGGQQSQPVMATAAPEAFQPLMPTQSQLHLMNQLAMISQFQHQGMSPAICSFNRPFNSGAPKV